MNPLVTRSPDWPESKGLTPISGGDRASTAPPIETGRYIDTAPDMETLKGYAFHRTMPGSTLTYGVTLLGEDITAKKRLVVRLYARKPDGDWQLDLRPGAARP